MTEVLSPLVPTVPTEKKAEDYRNYVDSKRKDIIAQTYRLHHTHQTYDFVQSMKKKASCLHERQNDHLGGDRKIRYVSGRK